MHGMARSLRSLLRDEAAVGRVIPTQARWTVAPQGQEKASAETLGMSGLAGLRHFSQGTSVAEPSWEPEGSVGEDGSD
jgi:hypothetical protein